MGLRAVPEGPEAEPIHKAAADFLAANISPKDISDFEKDFHRRKVAQGKLITLTLKILCADLPGWVRARQMQREVVPADLPADNSRTAQRRRASAEAKKIIMGGG
jgi:hypothetical protein